MKNSNVKKKVVDGVDFATFCNSPGLPDWGRPWDAVISQRAVVTPSSQVWRELLRHISVKVRRSPFPRESTSPKLLLATIPFLLTPQKSTRTEYKKKGNPQTRYCHFRRVRLRHKGLLQGKGDHNKVIIQCMKKHNPGK